MEAKLGGKELLVERLEWEKEEREEKEREWEPHEDEKVTSNFYQIHIPMFTDKILLRNPDNDTRALRISMTSIQEEFVDL